MVPSFINAKLEETSVVDPMTDRGEVDMHPAEVS
jgi:hypothetical protein